MTLIFLVGHCCRPLLFTRACAAASQPILSRLKEAATSLQRAKEKTEAPSNPTSGASSSSDGASGGAGGGTHVRPVGGQQMIVETAAIAAAVSKVFTIIDRNQDGLINKVEMVSNPRY